MPWTPTVSEFKDHKGVRLVCLAANFATGLDGPTFALTMLALVAAARGDRMRKGAPLIETMDVFHDCDPLRHAFAAAEDLVARIYDLNEPERARHGKAVSDRYQKLMGLKDKAAFVLFPGAAPLIDIDSYRESVYAVAMRSTQGSARHLRPMLEGAPFAAHVAAALVRVPTFVPSATAGVTWGNVMASRPTETAAKTMQRVLEHAPAANRQAYVTVARAAERNCLGARQAGMLILSSAGYPLPGVRTRADPLADDLDATEAPRPLWKQPGPRWQQGKASTT